MTNAAAKTVGVADYFAILGVGETLGWKHSQKGTDDADDHEDENEAAMLERFHREIVDVELTTKASITEESRETDSEHAMQKSIDESTVSSVENSLSSSTASQGFASNPIPTANSSKIYPGAPTTSPIHTVTNTREGFIYVERTCPAGNAVADGQFLTKVKGAETATFWCNGQTFRADLDPCFGYRRDILSQLSHRKEHSSLQGIGRRVGTSLRNQLAPILQMDGLRQTRSGGLSRTHEFILGYRRRRQDENDRPAIASLSVRYVRLHRETVWEGSTEHPRSPTIGESKVSQGNNYLGRGLASSALAAAELGKQKLLEKYRAVSNTTRLKGVMKEDRVVCPIEQVLAVPTGYDEWCFPQEYRLLKLPTFSKAKDNQQESEINESSGMSNSTDDGAAEGQEPKVPLTAQSSSAREDTLAKSSSRLSVMVSESLEMLDPKTYMPFLVPQEMPHCDDMVDNDDFLYIPAIAVRRQKIGEEQRFREDTAAVELCLSFCDAEGQPVLPRESYDVAEEDEEPNLVRGLSSWAPAESDDKREKRNLGTPTILVRKNLPIGFADAAFATKVLDRFPKHNYKGVPLPEEELPMFCYPTGCRLYRARFCDAPLPQYYGFVVKNERGDSIHVSCVSFMEPLTPKKVAQLAKMSEERRNTSLAHRRFCRTADDLNPLQSGQEEGGWSTDRGDSGLLLGFDDMVTFENKTICLVSRHPFWTSFRRFLLHLYILSGSSSTLPLERYISHLLLTVPLPRAGGANVLVPLPALNASLVFSRPPAKDFPLVDLPFQSLFACLDIPTVVTVVVGFLALERKLIVLSKRPSLVLDACELLRSLLFPFDLCAPYVPRLTQPFISCLEFPGAIFVGIHDDGTPYGLASVVRRQLPEDSAIVDLDSGEIDCSGDRYEVLKQSWGIIPSSLRSMLVSELETLCRDAGIVPGQEPIDSQIDSAFSVSLPPRFVEDIDDTRHVVAEPLDDRAVRDAFLRFFCAVLGGYERFLVVPDMDFMTSGNEWFDSQGFLANCSTDCAPFLGALVSTQLFQSFVQRRTEASDMQCLLFDECLIEYHSSPVPYGRLGGDVESVAQADDGPPKMVYSLLVDQCCADPAPMVATNDSIEVAVSDDSMATHDIIPASRSHAESPSMVTGDIITFPCADLIPPGSRFVYCIDGNPCFPHKFNPDYFFPGELGPVSAESSDSTSSLLTRSDAEIDEAQRRKRIATSYKGLNNQRRCLWQLPKLMGSHFLGAWLLCVPSQVSQQNLSSEHQAMYLLRALGAVRVLRNRRRIIPDEASYRALMVACGRTGSDRRGELVRLFGMLRSDGVFPSAVTLGQYTRALAEGYSKRRSGMVEEDGAAGFEVTMSGSGNGAVGSSQTHPRSLASVLNRLDDTLKLLEDSGRKWRLRSSNHSGAQHGQGGEAAPEVPLMPTSNDAWKQQRQSQGPRSWVPIQCSSSFLLTSNAASVHGCSSVKLVAIWSRVTQCTACSYIPLDEELQSGWDTEDEQNSLPCPRCRSAVFPKLGIREFTVDEALGLQRQLDQPPQIAMTMNEKSDDSNTMFVSYRSPDYLRSMLEGYVNELGESILERSKLKEIDAELFYNFWWYCARFSLPLPLTIDLTSDGVLHSCAFASWDRAMAEQGCRTAASVISEVADSLHESLPNDPTPQSGSDGLLTRLNLQMICQRDWDHPALSELLVSLVEACDKRAFTPVLERAIKNRSQLSDITNGEVDYYRIIMYLARYQCTTAFHSFFPSSSKPCKGYHFWCAFGTPLPVFDRLFREAAALHHEKHAKSMLHVSDVAIAFRCVFGHLI